MSMSVDLGLLVRRTEIFNTNLKAINKTWEDTKKKLEETTKDLRDHNAAFQLLQYMTEKLNAPSEQITAKLATLALKETFTDLNLSLEVEHSNLRGSPATILRLKDEDTGAINDPLDSFGGGPASLLSLVLRVVTIVRQPGLARILILDEPLVHVSKQYQDRAARLLRRLCEPPDRGGLGFKMLVVTHDPVFQAAAHKAYTVKRAEDGRSMELIQQVQNEDD